MTGLSQFTCVLQQKGVKFNIFLKNLQLLKTEILNTSRQVIRLSHVQRTAETYSFSCAISHMDSCFFFKPFCVMPLILTLCLLLTLC